MEKSVALKKEVTHAMCEARAEMMRPLHEKVDEAAMKLCVDEELDYILNTDDRAYLAIHPERGRDVTEQLMQVLKGE